MYLTNRADRVMFIAVFAIMFILAHLINTLDTSISTTLLSCPRLALTVPQSIHIHMISVVAKNKAHRKKHDNAVNATASNSKADRKCGNLPYSFLYFPDYCINKFLPKNTLLQSTNC